jgi:REP element-mobilizing transposase RayT
MTVDYNNLYVHYVLNTSGKAKMIEEKHRNRIEKYITGIINYNKSKLYAIFANAEHLHILISKSPQISEESLVTIIADSSAEFINKNNLCRGVFSWQQSCGAFSVSKGHVKRVCNYILNQAEHHKKNTFEEEYAAFIRFYEETIKPKIEPTLPAEE